MIAAQLAISNDVPLVTMRDRYAETALLFTDRCASPALAAEVPGPPGESLR